MDLVPTSTPSSSNSHYRLQIMRPGQLQSLTLTPIDIDREGLGSDEIRVDTAAIALHFKDVMLAMNMLPGFKPVLGLECSGKVSALGMPFISLAMLTHSYI